MRVVITTLTVWRLKNFNCTYINSKKFGKTLWTITTYESNICVEKYKLRDNWIVFTKLWCIRKTNRSENDKKLASYNNSGRMSSQYNASKTMKSIWKFIIISNIYNILSDLLWNKVSVNNTITINLTKIFPRVKYSTEQ